MVRPYTASTGSGRCGRPGMTTGTTRLVLLRHGETVWNLARRMQGHLDSELTALGRAQAAALARRLQRLQPQAIYCSDLGRALETAKVIADACGLSTTTDARLRERALGVLEGLTQPEAEAVAAQAWLGFTRGGPDFVVPGGESARQRFDRNLAAMSEIAARHPGACIVVVAHGGTLNTAFRACTGMPLDSPRTFALPNASVNVVDCLVSCLRDSPQNPTASRQAKPSNSVANALDLGQDTGSSCVPCLGDRALARWRLVTWGEVSHLESLDASRNATAR
ncbi:MAG: histidine phosphatase family protein [Polyangiaceae bacterium]|nr:histidine phosphatase family protein [Polyangiaceae bacterium]